PLDPSLYKLRPEDRGWTCTKHPGTLGGDPEESDTSDAAIKNGGGEVAIMGYGHWSRVPTQACESRLAALPSTRRPALQPAPSCPAARVSSCPALRPARRPTLQLASRTALPCSPERRALLPRASRSTARASRSAAARTSHPAALHGEPYYSQRIAPYCILRVALCCPARC
ncbi:unnamed protein product, partial [Closterium sp. NIES-53]